MNEGLFFKEVVGKNRIRGVGAIAQDFSQDSTNSLYISSD